MVRPLTTAVLELETPSTIGPEGMLVEAANASCGNGVTIPLTNNSTVKVSVRPPKTARHCSAVNEICSALSSAMDWLVTRIEAVTEAVSAKIPMDPSPRVP